MERILSEIDPEILYKFAEKYFAEETGESLRIRANRLMRIATDSKYKSHADSILALSYNRMENLFKEGIFPNKTRRNYGNGYSVSL